MIQRKVLSIFLIIVMLTTILPISKTFENSKPIDSLSVNEIDGSKNLDSDNTKGGDITIIIYYLGLDGTFEKNREVLTKSTYQNFIEEVKSIQQGTINFLNFVKNKLEIMKKYNLISNDLSVKNIINASKLNEMGSLSLNVTQTPFFRSMFAPIFMVGMGFGLGFGNRRMPIHPRLAGNLFSIGLIGLGGVMCLDIEDFALYYQYTFTFPYLFHILSGFIGIMMFAYDNISPPDNFPLTLYSNFIAIGMAGLAIGFEFPVIE